MFQNYSNGCTRGQNRPHSTSTPADTENPRHNAMNENDSKNIIQFNSGSSTQLKSMPLLRSCPILKTYPFSTLRYSTWNSKLYTHLLHPHGGYGEQMSRLQPTKKKPMITMQSHYRKPSNKTCSSCIQMGKTSIPKSMQQYNLLQLQKSESCASI